MSFASGVEVSVLQFVLSVDRSTVNLASSLELSFHERLMDCFIVLPLSVAVRSVGAAGVV